MTSIICDDIMNKIFEYLPTKPFNAFAETNTDNYKLWKLYTKDYFFTLTKVEPENDETVEVMLLGHFRKLESAKKEILEEIQEITNIVKCSRNKCAYYGYPQDNKIYKIEYSRENLQDENAFETCHVQYRYGMKFSYVYNTYFTIFYNKIED